MEPATKSEVLAYMRLHRFAVVASIGADGSPQASLVNIATTNELVVVFDTLTTSRKHANLQRDPRIAVTFSGPDEQTLQLEGTAIPVSLTDSVDHETREAYYEIWPEGRERVNLPILAIWRIQPRWARFSDYARGPLVATFEWNVAPI